MTRTATLYRPALVVALLLLAPAPAVGQDKDKPAEGAAPANLVIEVPADARLEVDGDAPAIEHVAGAPRVNGVGDPVQFRQSPLLRVA